MVCSCSCSCSCSCRKGKSVDATVPISALQFDRLMRDQLRRFLHPIFSKLESIEDRIQDLTQKVDNMTRPHPNHHDHEQEANQEGIGAESEGLATNEVEGKSTSIRLCFLNEMKTPIYHDDEIKSESIAALKIGIFNGDKMIKSGPLSKAKVKILALEGNFPYDAEGSWTAKEFDEHIAGGRDGKGDVLQGKGTNIQLIDGERDLGSIRFREGSCRARKGMFIVGARVRGGEAIGVRVQEAVMKPVVVRDRRNKPNEKSHPPKLDDRVDRLEGIAGKYCKRLEDKKIFTVEHFLKALNKDPNNLARILKIKKEHRPWEKMTRHARECHLEGKHKLKSYLCTEKNVKLFFDCVHRLVGAAFSSGRYTPSDKFNPAQEELVNELKEGVYAELDDLPEDHVMTGNSSDPIHMDTYAGVGAGPSYMSSATQQTCSGHLVAHQAVIEGLSHAQIEPSCAIANNDPGPSSPIPDHHSTHNYQGQIEASCAIANNDPGPSFSIPDPQSTLNYQDQEQFSSAFLNDFFQDPLGLLNSSELFQYGGYELAFLQPQADTINCVESPGLDQLEMQEQLFWPGNGTLEASTSAHSNITPIPQQLTTNGVPRSAQGSMQSQGQAPLPSNGASEAPASTHRTLPPRQWSECHGNMPRNRSL